MARESRPGSFSCARARRTCAHIMGVVVSDTSSDMRMAAESVIANSCSSRPMTPLMSRMGTNTATSDVLIDRTVKPTSCAPRRAASMGLRPASTWRDAFSSTTTASSTTKPVAMVSAINDRLSML